VDRIERRKHVRIRPLPELPIAVARLGQGAIHESLEVIDASVGGLALAKEGSLTRAEVGERFEVRLTLGALGEHRVDVVVRWTGPHQTGVEFVDMGPEPASAVRKYVAELLERGASS
jgi:hypothetical protein